MKQVLVLAMGMLCARDAEAQTFGIKGGVNFWNNIKTHDTDFETDFKLGLMPDCSLISRQIKAWTFHPNLCYHKKSILQ
jgi:hypothetical protein